MGASWGRGSAAALLLVLAAALAPTAVLAGSASDPEVVDDPGDVAVEQGDIPPVPGVTEGDFADVDIVAAFVSEFSGLTRITVQTSAGWTTGSLTLGFTVDEGPTSLAASTASGQAFTVFVNGTTVAGVNGTAATTTDGLRIDIPTAALGAVGGDLLSDLTVTTTRTDPGLFQGVPQDDQVGSDAAGPGRAYPFERPPVNPRLDLAIASVNGRAGALGSSADGNATASVGLRITNLGLDPDGWQLSLASDPALEDPPAFIQAFTPIEGGATAETTVEVSLQGVPAGPLALTFMVRSERGAQDTAVATIDVASPAEPPPSEREVKPAGLTFLTSGAEAMGLDDAFGSYGEAFLLALIVLLTILAIFLLLALGRSTTRGEPAAEAPWPTERGMPAAFAGPGGLAETVHATPASSAPAAAAAATTAAAKAPAEEELMDFGALMAASQELAEPEEPLDFAPVKPAKPAEAGLLPVASGATSPRIRIEEVRHTPREPEAGQRVATEVILRNDGPAASLRIALSVDGKPAAERMVQVPSRATKAVELPWTAGAGDNRVRIQAFPA